MTNPQRNISAVIAALCGVAVTTAVAQYSPVWYDGYNTTAPGTDINAQLGAPRQGGVYVPTTYLANVANQPGDYHQQLIGSVSGQTEFLMLAGDGFPPAPASTLVSPDLNFTGSDPGGIIGRRITLKLDVGASGANASSYITGGLTLGGNSPLLGTQSATPNFGVRFVEDNFSGNGAFIQLFDGADIKGNLIANPAGFGWIDLRLDINDPVDQNPWDGVGSTQIDVFVNDTQVGSYTKGGGGYTGNYLTLEGSPNFNGFGLALHYFDDLTVYAAPVPEPSTFALLGLGLAGLLVRRCRR